MTKYKGFKIVVNHLTTDLYRAYVIRKNDSVLLSTSDFIIRQNAIDEAKKLINEYLIS